jgi:hypothetical protein
MRALSLLILFALSASAADLGSLAGVVRFTNHPAARTIVYLGAGSGRVPATNAVLEARGGELQPHVQTTTRWATLVLRNGDPNLHVVRVDVLSGTNTPVRVLTQAMPYAGFQKAFSLDGFRDTALLRVTAGNDESMSAYVAVLPHPWAAVTDGNGRFTISAIPVGNYKIYAWHELLGTLTREVNITAGRTTAMDLEFVSR